MIFMTFMNTTTAIGIVACGLLVLAGIAIAAYRYSRYRRYSVASRHQTSKNFVRNSDLEEQPLLDNSAIRTLYVSDANGFARSIMDRPVSYTSNHSCFVPADELSNGSESRSSVYFSPTENVVVALMPSDVYEEDDGDSGIESWTSDDEAKKANDYTPALSSATLEEKEEGEGISTISRQLPHTKSTLNAQAPKFVPSQAVKAGDSATASSSSSSASSLLSENGVKKQNRPLVANRKCKYWPACSNRNCKYVHPQKTCRAYPYCSYGDNCIFVHPNDVTKINDVISRTSDQFPQQSHRKQRDIIRYNNLEEFRNHNTHHL